jgi:hypothetical protein
MLVTLGTLLGILYAVCVLGLFVYGANAYLMIALHRRGRRQPTATAPPLTVWPAVTVQLPIYNERYVARRLLPLRRPRFQQGRNALQAPQRPGARACGCLVIVFSGSSRRTGNHG